MKEAMRQLLTIALLALTLGLMSCENASNGQRVGYLTQFSSTGLTFKSYEGHLNMTQTGMNSAAGWDFSIDNDAQPDNVVMTLDSALELGWRVKLSYHTTFGKNWFHNRGHTSSFVTAVEVLDRPKVSAEDFSGVPPRSRQDTSKKL